MLAFFRAALHTGQPLSVLKRSVYSILDIACMSWAERLSFPSCHGCNTCSHARPCNHRFCAESVMLAIIWKHLFPEWQVLCLSQVLTKSGQKWLGSLLQLPGSDKSSAARIDANGSGQREEDSRAASSGIAAVVSSSAYGQRSVQKTVFC